MRLHSKLLVIIAPPALMSVFLIYFSVYPGIYEKAELDVHQMFDLQIEALVVELDALGTSEPSFAQLQQMLNGVIDENLERVLIISADAQVVADSANVLTGLRKPVLLAEREHDEFISDEELGLVDVTICRYLLANGNSVIAFLPKSQVAESIANIGKTLALSAFLGTTAGVVSFLILLRILVLKPLARVRKAAMRIGARDCSSDPCFNAVANRHDEIGDLARAIASSSARLTKSYDELQSSHEKIHKLAYLDALTNLPNRRMFDKVVSRRISQTQGDTPLYVLFVDIKDFKQVNDLFGHDSGDKLLCQLSERILECLHIGNPSSMQSTGHCMARLGGDEFVIMVDGEDGVTSGESVAAAIVDRLSTPFGLHNQTITIRASLGIAVYPHDGRCAAELISSADTAMYEAKKHRDSRFEHFTESMKTDLESRRKLELDLREAVTRGELFLNYQPKYGLRDMTLRGAEALVRWQHPTEGMIPPDRFISIAEDCGLIGEIGTWVLNEACRQWSEWDASGIGISQLAVNVSIRQFATDNLYELVCDTLKTHNMPPSALELELTESCVVEALDEVLEALTALRELGVKIAMDDFGTGYSSLGGIANLPIDTLKLDRSFVSKLSPGSPNEKIVTSVLMMAKGLNLSVVAEGIENQVELDFLREGECDLAQGYLLNRPLSAQVMSDVLTKEHEFHSRRSA